MKYHGKKNVGIQFGRLFGNYLKETEYSDVDIIIPVPLHKKKLLKRGYNQSEIIGLGLSQILNKPVLPDAVARIRHTKSQTRKSRYNRWLNVEDIFECVEPDKLVGRHALIVDDVVTTGATIESLASELLKLDGTKVSVVTIAVA